MPLIHWARLIACRGDAPGTKMLCVAEALGAGLLGAWARLRACRGDAPGMKMLGVAEALGAGGAP